MARYLAEAAACHIKRPLKLGWRRPRGGGGLVGRHKSPQRTPMPRSFSRYAGLRNEPAATAFPLTCLGFVCRMLGLLFRRHSALQGSAALLQRSAALLVAAAQQGHCAQARCYSPLGYDALGDASSSSLKGKTILLTGSTE